MDNILESPKPVFSVRECLMLPAALCLGILWRNVFTLEGLSNLLFSSRPGPALGAAVFTAALWAFVLLFLGKRARWNRYSIGLAIGVGLLVYEIVQPGSGVTPDVGTYVYSAETTELSILDSIVNIVPTSFVGAFTNMEMLQIIFLAILTGAAATLLDNGGDRQRVSDFLGLMNRLFLKIASIVMKAIPLVTFCAMTLLVLDMDGAMILALLKLVLSMGLGAVCMFVVYSLLLLLSLRRNPAKFFKKCIPNFISFITFCSTSAVMPQSLETCRKELGISPKISSFSMPLGSTINMDGACVYLTISILFLSAVYQVPITAGMLVQIGVTILILSMGAPPIAGAGFICLSILVQQVGIPLESLGILMGIDQIMSMCRTLINGTGDFVGTASVAKSENLMDLSVFDRR